MFICFLFNCIDLSDRQDKMVSQLVIFIPLFNLEMNHSEFIYNKEGKSNLVLRYSIPNASSNFRGIACCVAELNAAFCVFNRARKLNNYFPES